MENFIESERWFKDAKDCLLHAERCFKENYWRGTIQNAQLAIELSAKAFIAIFEEPEWTHNPSKQLITLIESRKDELSKKFGHNFLDEIIAIAENIKVSAPWHGWSVYGKRKEDSSGWQSAVDLCTKEVAEDLLNRARKTFYVVEKFLEIIKK